MFSRSDRGPFSLSQIKLARISNRKDACPLFSTDTKIVRYRKIMGEANPFDPNWRPYFEDRVVFKKFGVHLHKRPS